MFEALKGFASCDSNQGRSQDLSIGGDSHSMSERLRGRLRYELVEHDVRAVEHDDPSMLRSRLGLEGLEHQVEHVQRRRTSMIMVTRQ
jgi:hypothetical protein